ncbi:conserved hypothetical protein [Isorropodon fossajaponicum endosymbiont JTNG4]|uniref:UPF0149 family protein n=1 Tax=Isorropodon fossajaponicum symbiont TaxID=883811 RepID=UPI0019384CD0|nr:UPF0149 family protein [Isorropodon fossajaponicum symbiont]BBB23416.1 conserved hypothetical protein [Isorropodon fossajaponicum endosymbiont JTNG4]
MSNKLNFDQLKTTLYHLNTDDTISSAHGILCGLACVKLDLSLDLSLDDWLNEVLVSIDLNNLNEKSAHEASAQIFNKTLSQLSDETLDFQLLIADDEEKLGAQASTLIQWCQGYLSGLGLQKVSTTDEDALEMIKDLYEISRLDTNLLDNERNAQDLNEIIEFVRMGYIADSRNSLAFQTRLH